MCWQKVTKFCGCIKLKTGAWIISIINLVLIIFVLVENLAPFLANFDWAAKIYAHLKLEDTGSHQILTSVILGIILICNCILMLGIGIENAWLFIPGLIWHLFLVISLFVISILIYTHHWAESDLFYFGMVPGVTGFVFLYFWTVLYGQFYQVWSKRKKVMDRRATTQSL